MAKKVTAKNFNKVIENLKKYYENEVKGTGATEKAFLSDFNNFLNKLAEDDAFGTEGQIDPRGDQRDE
jgi:hypothetical protein